MIYLASPYSHPDPAVEEYRFQAVARVAGLLMLKGTIAFCPIAHSHPIYKLTPETGANFEDWIAMDLEMIDYCKQVLVLMLDGWQESRGVTAEIEYARSKGYSIGYIKPEVYNIAAN